MAFQKGLGDAHALAHALTPLAASTTGWPTRWCSLGDGVQPRVVPPPVWPGWRWRWVNPPARHDDVLAGEGHRPECGSWSARLGCPRG